jgi:ABC-type multidrug transport system fused ATPase/permease subunit
MTNSLFAGLNNLYKHLPAHRHWQVMGLIVFMLVGALAELATLGAVLPFLALMTDPSAIARFPVVVTVFSHVGLDIGANLMLYVTLLFGIAASVAALVRIALNWFSYRLTYAIGIDLGVEVYRRTLHQPFSFHVSRNTSEIISGLVKVQHVIFNVLNPFVHCVVSAIMAGAILLALLAIDAVVAIATSVILGILYVSVTLATRNRLQRNGKIISANETRRVQVVQEGLGGIRDVLLDNAQDVYVQRFALLERQLRLAQANNSVISSTPRFVIEALGMVVIAALAYQLSGSSTGFAGAVPVLGALALGAQRLLPHLQQIYYALTTLSANYQVLRDVLELLDMPVPVRCKTLAATAGHMCQGLELKGVSFRYTPESPDVLVGISLAIPRGSRVGLVGKTGSGKSTLVDLIMGLVQPTSGVVEVDGVSLQKFGLERWQSRVAHVPQSVYLADSSIAENIAFGLTTDQIDYAQLRSAALKAQIAEFIESLPEGYDTLVGESGVRLSGGQRQRIGLARSLYKDADVLILDEATSALDDATEAAVMAAVDKLGSELTVIMIAHRVTTLRACDLIVDLVAGQVEWKGAYGGLVMRQQQSAGEVI